MNVIIINVLKQESYEETLSRQEHTRESFSLPLKWLQSLLMNIWISCCNYIKACDKWKSR